MDPGISAAETTWSSSGVKTSYRIFHLIKGLGRGGAETLLAEGCRHFDRTQFTYGYGYFLPWKNALVSSLTECGADVFCFNCRHRTTMLLSVHRVRNILRNWKADLLHCHLPFAGVVGRLAARPLNIPVIYTEHNVWERYHWGTKQLNSWTWQYQDRVVAVSEEVKKSISTHKGNQVPVTVVRNGVPVDSFTTSQEERSEIRNRWNIPKDAIVVGTVAVFRFQKDLPTWLQAAALIKERYPEAHFLLVGDGPLQDELKMLVSRIGLSNCVHFTGLQEKVSPFYGAMDIYLNSSVFEGLPLSILEAMASRLPIVATAVGGVPEVVLHEQNGFLVQSRSATEIFQHISLLINNLQLRLRFGEEGQVLVKERFGIARMTRDLETIYLDELKRDHDPSIHNSTLCS